MVYPGFRVTTGLPLRLALGESVSESHDHATRTAVALPMIVKIRWLLYGDEASSSKVGGSAALGQSVGA